MPYISNTEQDRREMKAAIGITDLEDLLKAIPPEVRLKEELDLPPAADEVELSRQLNDMAAANNTVAPQNCFMGGGVFQTYIPETVKTLATRSEFMTAYTPYQAEVSQGTLQTVFEFQTMICQLTDMDIANASMYDGATAMVEAMRMAMSINRKRTRLLVAGNIIPRWREVLNTYFACVDVKVDYLQTNGLLVNQEELREKCSDDLVAIVIQSPNAFGMLEDVKAISALAKENGALLIQGFDPLSLGLFQTPGECGVDIAIAEGQVISQPLQYGGPYLGLFAAGQEFIKQMPGRLIGETLDANGDPGYVLTFQTREQHIRRDKATSNICTNQALAATFATVNLALLGASGVKDKAQMLYSRACELADSLQKIDGVEFAGEGEFFREFPVVIQKRDALLTELRKRGILGGLVLPDNLLKNGLLISVNEYMQIEDIENLVYHIDDVLNGGNV
jgi:glycine dehydrogenase subunit 1